MSLSFLSRCVTHDQKHQRKSEEAESESTSETSRKASKKQKTVVAPERCSECIFRQYSDLTRAAKSLRISSGSDSRSRSSYDLKDLPSDASKFTEEDIVALNAIFKPADDDKIIMPDVEVTDPSSQYLLPDISRDVLKKQNFDVRMLNTTDKF
ncbi:15261_t:CDS:2, partial [Funneliformis caledonium]